MFASVPLKEFYGDCESCKYYIVPNRGFITGGNCAARNYIACGYGFTCDKYSSIS